MWEINFFIFKPLNLRGYFTFMDIIQQNLINLHNLDLNPHLQEQESQYLVSWCLNTKQEAYPGCITNVWYTDNKW